MKIGCHVSFGKEQLLGSVKEAVSYGANAFMFYTGAPQNTMRSAIADFKTIEAYNMLKENGIRLIDVVCHAPYIVNLANNKDLEKYRFSIDFLIQEIERCSLLGVKYLVLHPGSAVGLDRMDALKNIIYALNIVLERDENIVVLLETMAGKGTELGTDIEEIKTIIDGVNKKELIGVCLDTCHLNDSGVDISKFDDYLDEFDEKIGLDRIKVLHLNDSKNGLGSRKDRHELIGYGTIGFNNLLNVVLNERLSDVPKILETPYIGNNDEDKERLYPPYKFEISMLKSGVFDENLKEKIRDFYEKKDK